MKQAKFLSRPILFKSGWNWYLKFGFLGHYGQKTIFQTKWTKNVDKLKVFLVCFSRTKWRGQLALSFLHRKYEKKSSKCLFFSQAFSSSSFAWALLYLRAVLCSFRLCLLSFLFLFYKKRELLVDKTLIEIESEVVKKKVQFCFFQNILPATIFYHRQRDIQHILNLV